MSAAHHTHAYRQARAARIALGRRRGDTCALADLFPNTCPGYIDYTAKYPDPWSPTAEHIIPASQGGTHDLLDVAHLDCQRRQGGIIATSDTWDAIPPIRRSPTWL